MPNTICAPLSDDRTEDKKTLTQVHQTIIIGPSRLAFCFLKTERSPPDASSLSERVRIILDPVGSESTININFAVGTAAHEVEVTAIGI